MRQRISVLLIILSGLISLPLLVHSTPAANLSRGTEEQGGGGDNEAVRNPSRQYHALSAPKRERWQPAQASLPFWPANLLVNGDFEQGFSVRGDDKAVTVANGWEPWYVPGTGFPLDRPEWSFEDIWTHQSIRVFHGDRAQKMFGQGKVHIAGIYQQVPIPQGSRMRFSIRVQVWSSHCDNPCVSPLELCNLDGSHGNYEVAVGIDPTGGTDPLADTVNWINKKMPWEAPYDEWVHLTVEDVAQSDHITVFTRGQAEFPVKHNDSYWDSARLELLEAPVESFLPLVARNFEAPTPIATGTVPVTLTPTSTPSSSPTPALTGTPTSGVTATPTTVGTVTATPTSTSTGTPTPMPTITCQDAVANGDFESEGEWTIAATTHPAGYSTAHAFGESGRSMRLGIEAGDIDTESMSYVTQAIPVPADAVTATLNFKYYPVSEDLEGDHFEAILWDAQGQPLTFLLRPTRSNAQEWLEHSVDLTRYAGQTVQLYFNVFNNGLDGVSAVYLDDVVLEVCGPAGTLAQTQLQAITPPRLADEPPYSFEAVWPTWVRYSAEQLRFPEPQTCDDLRIEFVQFESFGEPTNVAGWTLEDSEGNIFVFPNLRLDYGDQVRVWSRSGLGVPTDLYWNSPIPLLDNDGDRLTLRNEEGEIMAEICYSVPDQVVPGACE